VPVHRTLLNGLPLSLNEQGRAALGETQRSTSRTELCQVILDTYDTNEEAASVDLEAFLDELQAIGALQKA
jgi:hypothetical protein